MVPLHNRATDIRGSGLSTQVSTDTLEFLRRRLRIDDEFDAAILGSTRRSRIRGTRMIRALGHDKKLVFGKLVSTNQMVQDRGGLRGRHLMAAARDHRRIVGIAFDADQVSWIRAT